LSEPVFVLTENPALTGYGYAYGKFMTFSFEYEDDYGDVHIPL